MTKAAIIIGNIFSLCAMISDSISGTRKKHSAIMANLQYSVAVFKLKDNEKALKLSFIINVLMFAVFNTVIMNYVGTASCVVIAVTTAISLINAIKDKRGEDDEH